MEVVQILEDRSVRGADDAGRVLLRPEKVDGFADGADPRGPRLHGRGEVVRGVVGHVGRDGGELAEESGVGAVAGVVSVEGAGEFVRSVVVVVVVDDAGGQGEVVGGGDDVDGGVGLRDGGIESVEAVGFVGAFGRDG